MTTALSVHSWRCAAFLLGLSRLEGAAGGVLLACCICQGLEVFLGVRYFLAGSFKA